MDRELLAELEPELFHELERQEHNEAAWSEIGDFITGGDGVATHDESGDPIRQDELTGELLQDPETGDLTPDVDIDQCELCAALVDEGTLYNGMCHECAMEEFDDGSYDDGDGGPDY
jgi:hypothetical protein